MNVASLAQRFDAYDPKWIDAVSVVRLDMTSPVNCLLAQWFSSYWDGKAKLGINHSQFYVITALNSRDYLDQWIEEIKNRRAFYKWEAAGCPPGDGAEFYGQMTNQETFDTMAIGLLKQGCRSIGVDTMGKICMYRGPDGRKCPAGMLIPDVDYQKAWEGGAVKIGSPVGQYLKDRGFDIALVQSVQYVHDNKDPKEFDWRFELNRVAAAYGLKSVNTEMLR